MTTRSLTVVTPTFYPEAIGTPHYATDLARWFAEQGWDVRVVTAQPFYPQFKRYPGYDRSRRHDEVDGIPVLRLPTIVPPYGKVVGRVANELNFALQARLHARGRKTASVLSISPGTPGVTKAANAYKAPGGRHVALVHDVQSGLAHSLGMVPARLKRVLERGERDALNSADAIAVLTPEMGSSLLALGITKPLHVAPLWATASVDPDALPAAAASVQYSGNFGQKQGVDLLAPIAAELARRDASIPLVLRGSGHRFDLIRSDLEASGSNVSFEALVPAAQLAEALASSPVHVVLQAPGAGEFSMPSKVINALSCGSHVVAFADDDSPLARLADELPGLETFPQSRLADAVDRIVQLVRAPGLEAERRRIAVEAASRISRDKVLHELAALL